MGRVLGGGEWSARASTGHADVAARGSLGPSGYHITLVEIIYCACTYVPTNKHVEKKNLMNIIDTDTVRYVEF